MIKMEPIVHKLKRLIRERNISHASIAEKMGKHRTFITKKLGGDSMETRLLEGILEVTGITPQEMFCEGKEDSSLREDLDSLKKEVNILKEHLPPYNS